MKPQFVKISSILLAFLVLLSTFSITIERHFCGDFLVDVSYFGDADGCSHEEGASCDLPEVIEKEGCCKDELQKIEGQDELRTVSTEDFDIKKQQFILAFVLSYNNLFTISQKQIVPNQHYFPPQVVKDLQVLHEVFII